MYQRLTFEGVYRSHEIAVVHKQFHVTFVLKCHIILCDSNLCEWLNQFDSPPLRNSQLRFAQPYIASR